MANPPPRPPAQVQLTYAGRSEVSETFADLLHFGIAEGFNVKLEFVVNRPDPAQGGGLITGHSVTSCQLVMPLPGVIDMVNKLGGLLASLQLRVLSHRFRKDQLQSISRALPVAHRRSVRHNEALIAGVAGLVAGAMSMAAAHAAPAL